MLSRIRSIKPDFFISHSVNGVTLEASYTFIGLWTQADDCGRAVADPRLIKGAVWPMRDAVSSADVEVHLKELESEGMICRYEADGRHYLHVCNWWKHQKVYHRTPARYPFCPIHGDDEPPMEDARETRAPARKSRARVSESLPLSGSGSGSGSVSGNISGSGSQELPLTAPLTLVATPVGAAVPEPSFDDFWAIYPRKVGKDQARKAWASAAKRTAAADIVAGAQRYRDDPNLPEPRFVPHPATWLNGGRWDDEPCAPRHVSARPSNDDVIRAARARAGAVAPDALALGS